MGEKLNENIFEFIASECLLKHSGNCISEKCFMICGMTLGWVGEVLREIQQIVYFVNINALEMVLPPAPIFFMLTGTKSKLLYTYEQFSSQTRLQNPPWIES